MGVVSRKERDRQLRKTDILRSAERVFALKGYDGATIQDIAKEAQYAVGTVYLYFKDKESLYFSLVEDKISSMVAGIKERVGNIKGAEEKLRVFVEESLEFFENNQDFFQIFVSERGQHQWSIDRKLSQCHELRDLKFLTGIIELAQKEGVVKRELNARQAADILASLFAAVLFDWINDQKHAASLRAMSEYVLDIFLNGVRKR